MNRYSRRAAPLALALLTTTTASAANIDSNWIAADGDWDDAANWSSPAFPNNDVIDQYSAFIENGFDVTYDALGAIVIYNLTVGAGNNLRFDGTGSSLLVNNLSIVAGIIKATNGAVVDLGGGTLNDAGLEATKSIGGQDGASLTSTATSFAGSLAGNAGRTLRADGTGTLLDLGALTSFTRPTSQFATLNITARDGGTVDLSALTSFTPGGGSTQNNLIVTADNGVVNLAGVQHIADRVTYAATDGGTIIGTLLTALDAALTKGGGSTLDFSGLTDVTGSVITAIDGGVITLGAGTIIDDTSLIARKSIGGNDNAQLTALATAWAGSAVGNTSRELKADGTGTTLDLSTLTSFTRPNSQFAAIDIRARDGGSIDLSALTSFTAGPGSVQSNLVVTADNGTVDLSGMQHIADRVTYAAVNGGTIVGALITALDAALTKGGNGSVLDFSSLTDVTGSVITAIDSGVVTLGAGTVIDDTSLIARKSIGGSDNAQLTALATAWAGSTVGNTGRELKAEGTGTMLDLSTLTSFTRPTSQFAAIDIRARDGGSIDLSALTSFTAGAGSVQSNLVVTADNGAVDLSAMQHITDRVTFAAVDGGTIVGALITALDAALTKGGNGSVLDFSNLTDVTGSVITAIDSGVVTLGAGTVIDDTSLIARKSIGGSDNAMLVSTASTWAGSTSGNTGRELKADGTGTMLDLSTLTSFTRPTSQFAAVDITARNGGTVDLSGLSSFTPSGGAVQSNLDIRAVGAGSMIDISALTALDNADLTFDALGHINLASLTALSNGTLKMDGTAGAANVNLVPVFTLGDGGEFDMNGATNALVIGSVGVAQAGAVNILADGHLGGTGLVTGTLNNLGTLNPGLSPGTFNVDGNYQQGAGASLAIEIAAPGVFDILNVTGTASLAGALHVSLAGYAPNPGDEFVFLLAAAGLAGSTFDSVTPSAGGFFLSVVYGADFAKLVVGSAVPVPAALWLLLGAIATLFCRARRAGAGVA